MTHPAPETPECGPPARDRPVLSVGLRSEFEDRLLEEREWSRDRLDAGVGEGPNDRLSEIDGALVRLRQHPERYGACETCGASIDLERLQVVPWARHCGEHIPSDSATHRER